MPECDSSSLLYELQLMELEVASLINVGTKRVVCSTLRFTIVSWIRTIFKRFEECKSELQNKAVTTISLLHQSETFNIAFPMFKFQCFAWSLFSESQNFLLSIFLSETQRKIKESQHETKNWVSSLRIPTKARLSCSCWLWLSLCCNKAHCNSLFLFRLLGLRWERFMAEKRKVF